MWEKEGHEWEPYCKRSRRYSNTKKKYVCVCVYARQEVTMTIKLLHLHLHVMAFRHQYHLINRRASAAVGGQHPSAHWQLLILCSRFPNIKKRKTSSSCSIHFRIRKQNRTEQWLIWWRTDCLNHFWATFSSGEIKVWQCLVTLPHYHMGKKKAHYWKSYMILKIRMLLGRECN